MIDTVILAVNPIFSQFGDVRIAIAANRRIPRCAYNARISRQQSAATGMPNSMFSSRVLNIRSPG